MSSLTRLPPCLALTILVGLVLAAPSDHLGKRSITDGSQVSGKTYDYVIAGGGLGGTVLASRLSEDSTKTGMSSRGFT
jgi:choline dehydrogenase